MLGEDHMEPEDNNKDAEDGHEHHDEEAWMIIRTHAPWDRNQLGIESTFFVDILWMGLDVLIYVS